MLIYYVGWYIYIYLIDESMFMKKCLVFLLVVFSSFILVDECVVIIESNDMMQFNMKEMFVFVLCDIFEVMLKYIG